MQHRVIDRSEAIAWLTTACQKVVDWHAANPGTRRPATTLPATEEQMNKLYLGEMCLVGVEAHGTRVAGCFITPAAAIMAVEEKYPGFEMQLSRDEDAVLVSDNDNGTPRLALRAKVIGAEWAETGVTTLARLKPGLDKAVLKRIGQMDADAQRDILAAVTSS